MQRDAENKYSVIVPVYNSEKSLSELYTRIKTLFDEELEFKFELILVNDSSRDNSWRIMLDLHERDSRVKIINLARNFGQHPALLCGLKYFTGDYVIMMDDDLQHPPEEIAVLINSIHRNPEIDVVFGDYDVKKHSWFRNLGSHITNIVGRIVTKRQSEIKVTSFRIMRASLAHKLSEINIQKPGIGNLIMFATNKIISVKVKHHPRVYGKSGYRLSRLYKDFLSIVIGNSVLPLKVISTFGVIISFGSLLIAAYYIFRYFVKGRSVVGWTSLIVAITFFSGFILFTLGIIGEYLIRILMETKKMPVYVERDVIL